MTRRASLSTLTRMRGSTLDHGLLLTRLGMGVMFMLHGWPKISGGVTTWAKLGGAMRHVGVAFGPPEMWGFLGALSEFGGGLLVALGLLFSPACGALVATMFVATMMHLGSGDSVMSASHAIEAGVVFLGLALTGPGRFALGGRLMPR